MNPVAANREVYALVREGVRVEFLDPKTGDQTSDYVRVMDWDHVDNNDFLLVNQFWVTGEMHTRRADMVGFVNGIPLLFVELKANHKKIKSSFDDNLRDYKDTIPHIFWYNAAIILSNGSESMIGSMSAAWEHFSEWKKINDEGEEGVISLETIIRGTCERSRFLDIVENFTLFQEVRGGLVKLVGKNHQYLGVNNAIAALGRVMGITDLPVHATTGQLALPMVAEDPKEYLPGSHGRLGVYWHTQGSGKSVSMILFAQKVLRKVPGNWTFVVVTDREDLDDQIYKEFARSGAVTETEAQATSAKHLRQLLGENHRYVFTLIQKFRTERGETHPVLSERSDIIVMTDEAHRSQYDTLAMNMRTALPRAAFLAFTGTPLIAGEERTREVFGDYVSVYDFAQSIEDKATVPLYYENRIPELQLTNENLNEDIYAVVEAAELDEEQEKKLEREFARQYHLVTRDDRLEAVARDLVAHFMGRGFRGKAMVVSIDKATAVRMYDKVQKHWNLFMKEMRGRLKKATPEERERIESDLEYMRTTDMAVVVSQGQNEIDDMKKKGLDIKPHRKRMLEEDLDTKFKDPEDGFRIVFVCAMWMTGFDVPSCSTIYLDKPMRNHTLMQTIARANQVFRDKVNGLIVDYVGVFRNLQKALAIYGPGGPGGGGGDGGPVKPKSELVAQLRRAIIDTVAYAHAQGAEIEPIKVAQGFDRAKLIDDAAEILRASDTVKKGYLNRANLVGRLFKAILPDPEAGKLAPDVMPITVIANKILSLMPTVDISDVMAEVERILDSSIATEGYLIRDTPESKLLDLSQIDFDALAAKFKAGRKRTEFERLKALVEETLNNLVEENRTRIDFLERFQKLIDDYNAGSANIEELWKQLVDFAKGLNEEARRHVSERLTEEELALFDILTKPALDLTEKERQEVKKAARELLDTLKTVKLVIDWRKRQAARAAVRQHIEVFLDANLPDRYSKEVYSGKCEAVYQHVYDSYYGGGRSVYV
jgi:type I restriction enzyme R subunit